MTTPVRIPVDVERPDRVLGSLTARQVAILAVTGIVLYGAWTATRTVIGLPLFLILVLPLAVGAVLLALGQRDGITLDRLALAAIRHRFAPRYRVAAPGGVRPAPDWLTHRAIDHTLGGAGPAALELLATGVHPGAGAVSGIGVVDLGPDGLAALAVVSTVNFALRTPAEQEGLVAGFGRYLHCLNAPMQFLIRTHRLDLTSQITDLRVRAGGLAHPALEAAALDHADYLTDLARHTDLLGRQVLLVVRESWRAADSVAGAGGQASLAAVVSFAAPRRRGRERHRADTAARRAAESRLARRLADAADVLTPIGIVVTPLDAGQATVVLAAACNPDTVAVPSAGLAGADEIITTPAASTCDPYHPDEAWRDPADNRAEDSGDAWDDAWDDDTDDHRSRERRWGA